METCADDPRFDPRFDQRSDVCFAALAANDYYAQNEEVIGPVAGPWSRDAGPGRGSAVGAV